MKSLWILGETVQLEQFPKFLDCTAVQAILDLAYYTTRINKLSALLQHSSTTTQAALRDKWNNVQQRLHGLAKTVRTRKQELSFDNDTKKLRVKWGDLRTRESTENLPRTESSEILQLEQQISNCKEQIKRLQDAEVKRLTYLFALSNFEHKHRVTLRELVSTLVGYELAERHSAVISKHQETLFSQLACCQTFKFSSK